MKEELEKQAWEELERLWGEHDERVEQLAREYPPKRKRGARIVPLWRYAAAAMVAGVLVMGAWLWMGRPTQKTPLLAENRIGGEHVGLSHDNDNDSLRYDNENGVGSSGVTELAEKPSLPWSTAETEPQRVAVGLSHDNDNDNDSFRYDNENGVTSIGVAELAEKPSLPWSTAETKPQRVSVELRQDKDNDSLRYDNENGMGLSGMEEHTLALVEEVVRVNYLAEETPSHPGPIKVWSDHKPNIIEQLAMGFLRRRENRRMIRDGILAEKM